MKKEYIKPTTKAVAIKSRHHLLAGSPYATQASGNVFTGSLRGGNGNARSRDNDWWDDEE